ncbi:MAG TPA: cupin domain-containing protein [Acidobacteriota bacterium]|nr:cupin domain-containing protein [Acidobacteriota bacterium]
MNSKVFIVLLFLLSTTIFANAQSVDEILQRFASDYQSDINLKEDSSFGIQVDDEMWTVSATAAKGTIPAKVVIQKGKPQQPTFYFTLDRASLLKIDKGELNAKTAMAKAFESDKSPMDIEAMEGFVPPQDFTAKILETTFHFWTRGFPEVIRYGDGHTRFTHGADVTVFYYQPGLRSAWGSLKKGMHANENPKSQTNEFPSLVIVTQGKGQARIGGKEMQVEKGQAIFIPKDVTHEFWNNNDQPLEIILLMFGEGA